MLHSLFYLETVLHVSGGTTTHHQERKQLYLQYLVFVTLLLLSAARVINNRILVELLGIREDSVIFYLRSMNPLAHLAYFSILKLVYYILVYGARRLLMLDGDSLILLDVMKVVLYYIFYPITIVL
jgi:hypothetical protein